MDLNQVLHPKLLALRNPFSVEPCDARHEPHRTANVASPLAVAALFDWDDEDE